MFQLLLHYQERTIRRGSLHGYYDYISPRVLSFFTPGTLWPLPKHVYRHGRTSHTFRDAITFWSLISRSDFIQSADLLNLCLLQTPQCKLSFALLPPKSQHDHTYTTLPVYSSNASGAYNTIPFSPTTTPIIPRFTTPSQMSPGMLYSLTLPFSGIPKRDIIHALSASN